MAAGRSSLWLRRDSLVNLTAPIDNQITGDNGPTKAALDLVKDLLCLIHREPFKGLEDRLLSSV